MKGKNILCLSTVHWDSHTSVEQQIVGQLAQHNRVVYVNRQLTLLSLCSRNEEVSIFRQAVDFLLGPKRVHGNLSVLTPPAGLFLRFERISNLVNCALIRIWLFFMLKSLKFEPDVVWTFAPESAGVLAMFPSIPAIYHCVDEHTGWGHWWNSRRAIERREQEVLSRAAVVFATSRNLAESKKRFNPRTHFVPNAADYDLFSRAAAKETAVPGDLSCLSRPVIGFVGTIRSIVDLELIEYCARQRPEWTFALVGGVTDSRVDAASCARAPNIKFLGPRPVSLLPAYLKGMDVCLIPYRCAGLGDGTFPLKLFEYLAAGKAVVATRLPSLIPFGEIIKVAGSREDFLAAIGASLDENGGERVSRRQDIARRNTWEKRMEEISAILEKELAHENRDHLDKDREKEVGVVALFQ